MMKNEKMTLKSQLLIYISLLVIVLSIFISLVIYKLSNHLIIKQIGLSRVDVLKQVGERISGVKSSMLYVLNTISSNSEINSQLLNDKFDQESQEYFEMVLDNLTNQIDSAFLSSDFNFDVECYSGSGYYFSTKDGLPGSLSAVKSEIWFKELLNSPEQILWIGSSVSQMKDTKGRVSAVKAIVGSNGKIEGVIIVSVDEILFGETYENILNQENDIFIVDNKGKIVSSNQKQRLGLAYFNLEKLSEMVGGERYALFENQQGDKKIERLISAVYDDSSLWTMVEFIKTEKIFSEMHEITLQIELFVVAVILVVGAWGWYFANKTVRPLRQLECDIERVKKGDIYVETEIRGWKEIYSIRSNFNEMMVKIQELMEDIKKKEIEKHKLELDFLQAQMNPHFLYNTLFSIKCMIEMDEKEESILMISDFIDLLRMVLKKDGEYIILSKELECIQKYVAILKYCYEDKFDIYFDIPKECETVLVPKLILQPIIENAVFHGLEPENRNGMIVISAKKEDKRISIAVSDDGIGMDRQRLCEVMRAEEGKNESLNHIGMWNVNSRIQLLYGEEYGLQIESELGYGTTVTIELPCEIGE